MKKTKTQCGVSAHTPFYFRLSVCACLFSKIWKSTLVETKQKLTQSFSFFFIFLRKRLIRNSLCHPSQRIVICHLSTNEKYIRLYIKEFLIFCLDRKPQRGFSYNRRQLCRQFLSVRCNSMFFFLMSLAFISLTAGVLCKYFFICISEYECPL